MPRERAPLGPHANQHSRWADRSDVVYATQLPSRRPNRSTASAVARTVGVRAKRTRHRLFTDALDAARVLVPEQTMAPLRAACGSVRPGADGRALDLSESAPLFRDVRVFDSRKGLIGDPVQVLVRDGLIQTVGTQSGSAKWDGAIGADEKAGHDGRVRALARSPNRGVS